MMDLELAYAITIHKAQGSEFPVVVLPVPAGNSGFFSRQLVYTALTRARKMAVCIGDEATFLAALRPNRGAAAADPELAFGVGEVGKGFVLCCGRLVFNAAVPPLQGRKHEQPWART